MSIIKDVLGVFSGRLRFHLSFEGKPAVDIIITSGEVIIEIKNPLVALEMGLSHVGNKSKFNSYIIKMIKASGYKIKVKYKMIEFEL